MAEIIKRIPLASIDEIETLTDGGCLVVTQNGESYRFSIEKFCEKYATTDYTELQNNPKTLITTSEFCISDFKDGAYEVASDQVEIVDEYNTRGSFLHKGTDIYIDGNAANVIAGGGSYYISNRKDIEKWNLDDYCPTLSDVEELLSSIDMTDIDVSQALVNFQSPDKESFSMTLKEIVEDLDTSLVWCDEQILTKQDKIQLGDGLKWLNGKLTLDIPDGDNLTYGTQAVEINENEVVTNE